MLVGLRYPFIFSASLRESRELPLKLTLSMVLTANFTLSSMQNGEFRFEPTCWLLESREWRGLARCR